MALTTDSVALYWDFENLHASLVDQLHGQGSYLASRFRPQDEVMDVATLVEFALSVGPIAINRAYANWVSFNRYKVALLQTAVELIQVFPPGANAKNGADIKLCLDVMEDMVRFPHITTFVVVGGDSDYMPLSYKVKAAGRTLIGIGSKRTTNQHWARSCHEFKYYENLVAPPTAAPAAQVVPAVPAPADAAQQPPAQSASPAETQPPATAEDQGQAAPPAAVPSPGDAAAAQASPDPARARAPALPLNDELRQLLDAATAGQQQQREAAALVTKALQRLSQMRGEPWVQKARLRPFIQRMDSTFHESNYGYASFNELLASLGGLIDTRRGEFDHELRLAEPARPAEPTEPAQPLDAGHAPDWPDA